MKIATRILLIGTIIVANFIPSLSFATESANTTKSTWNRVTSFVSWSLSSIFSSNSEEKESTSQVSASFNYSNVPEEIEIYGQDHTSLNERTKKLAKTIEYILLPVIQESKNDTTTEEELLNNKYWLEAASLFMSYGKYHETEMFRMINNLFNDETRFILLSLLPAEFVAYLIIKAPQYIFLKDEDQSSFPHWGRFKVHSQFNGNHIYKEAQIKNKYLVRKAWLEFFLYYCFDDGTLTPDGIQNRLPRVHSILWYIDNTSSPNNPYFTETLVYTLENATITLGQENAECLGSSGNTEYCDEPLDFRYSSAKVVDYYKTLYKHDQAQETIVPSSITILQAVFDLEKQNMSLEEIDKALDDNTDFKRSRAIAKGLSHLANGLYLKDYKAMLPADLKALFPTGAFAQTRALSDNLLGAPPNQKLELPKPKKDL